MIPLARSAGSVVKAQFALPRGPLGRLAGWIMVQAGQYSGLNQDTIELLDSRGAERVLEIGFGPGEAIHLLADRAPSCRLAGIDPSAVMLARARRRNRPAVLTGRADLRLGSAEELPWPDQSFDAIFAVNTAQLWTLAVGISEIHRVLAPGGRVVLALHQRCVTRDGQSICGLELQPQLVDALTAAGLAVTTTSRPGKGGTAVYVTGQLASRQRADDVAS